MAKRKMTVKAPINFVGYANDGSTRVRCDLSQTVLFGSVVTLPLPGTPFEFYTTETPSLLKGRVVEFSYDGVDEAGKVIMPSFIKLED